MSKPTSEQDGAFVFDTPNQSRQLEMQTDSNSDVLFDLVDTGLPRPEQPVDIPERIVVGEPTTAEDAALAALSNVMKTLSMRGRIQGIQTINGMTGDNRFQTGTKHPLEVQEFMDGKEDALAKKNLRDYDILNDTAARLAAGEDPTEVAASRERFKRILESEFKTGATRRVDVGDRTVEVRVDADHRRKLLADSDAVKRLVASLRIRTR
jgi:hypothetical protein